MQSIYRYYDKGDISYGQLSYMLKEMNLEVPPEGKISNFKEFQKAVKQQKQVPQITINLRHQLKCTMDDLESPKVGRRFVTLGDSPMMKNENSYLFKNGKRDEKSMSRDARLSSNNIYIEQKKKVIPGIVTNGNILTHQDANIELLTQSARGIQSYRKNDSSVKIGNGLFSQRENQKKDLVKVTNKEQKGSGNIIQNQVTLAVKPKVRLQLESNIKFTE